MVESSSWIDISMPLRPGMAVWPGAPEYSVTWRRKLDRGETSNNSNISLNVHTGTHVDSPFHFLPKGPGVENLSLDALIGPATILDLTDVSGAIRRDDLSRVWPKGANPERVLLKTSNSERWPAGPEFFKDFIALSLDAARFMVEKKVRTIGIDALSIQTMGDSPETHHVLLEAGIVLVEGLVLNRCQAGEVDFACLPLLLVGLDGAPARACVRPRRNTR
jgi:arylformamidase